MSEETAHYGLTKLDPSENISANDWAFTGKNIDRLDYLTYLGAEGHHHDGVSAAALDPTLPVQVTLVPGAGNIPGGRILRYRYSLVDLHGAETAASPEITLSTPAAVSPPQAPSLLRGTSGTLIQGNYFYTLTAYTTVNTLETTPGPRAYTTCIALSTNSITLTLPSLPNGAKGFNIYRRRPGSMRFQYLDSVDMDVATPPTTYVDSGSATEDCNRTVPQLNNTAASNSVIVTLPGATPTVPAGYTWKLYRSYTSGAWGSTLLHWTVEETSEGSGIITPTYTDVGSATVTGTPPERSEIAGSPDLVQLTDATEVQGTLPPGRNVVPVVLNFTQAGLVTVQNGTFLWVNEYDEFSIVSVRASLGVDFAPSTTPVIADVLVYRGATPTWMSIIDDTGNRPSVPVGEMIGLKYDLVSPDLISIATGEALRVDVIQAGGGATPTDYNLMVTVVGFARYGSTTTSLVF